jgi:hypothetical protein
MSQAIENMHLHNVHIAILHISKSFFLLPWYIYKIHYVTFHNEVKCFSLKNILKAYLFFPFFITKIYYGLTARENYLREYLNKAEFHFQN